MRVLVYGGRRYADRERVFAELDAIHVVTPITIIIQGEATGADALAKAWAERHGIPTADFKAEWDRFEGVPRVRRKFRLDGSAYNAAAGGTRNNRMMVEGKPDIALEFPGGDGTNNMRRIVLQEMQRRTLRYIQIKR